MPGYSPTTGPRMGSCYIPTTLVWLCLAISAVAPFLFGFLVFDPGSFLIPLEDMVGSLSPLLFWKISKTMRNLHTDFSYRSFHDTRSFIIHDQEPGPGVLQFTDDILYNLRLDMLRTIQILLAKFRHRLSECNIPRMLTKGSSSTEDYVSLFTIFL